MKAAAWPLATRRSRAHFTQSRTENTDQNLDLRLHGRVQRGSSCRSARRCRSGPTCRRYEHRDRQRVRRRGRADHAGRTLGGPDLPAGLPRRLPATFDFVRDSSTESHTDGVRRRARACSRPSARSSASAIGWPGLERDYYEVEKTTTNTLLRRRAKHARQEGERAVPGAVRGHQGSVPAPPGGDPGRPAAVRRARATLAAHGPAGTTRCTRSRQADLTSFPSRNLFVEGMITVTPTERLAITGHYRCRDSENDELNYSEWGRTAHSPGRGRLVSRPTTSGR